MTHQMPLYSANEDFPSNLRQFILFINHILRSVFEMIVFVIFLFKSPRLRIFSKFEHYQFPRANMIAVFRTSFSRFWFQARAFTMSFFRFRPSKSKNSILPWNYRIA